MSARAKRMTMSATMTMIVLVAWWLVEAESSPLRWYFLNHPAASNLFAFFSLPAVFIGIIFSGNAHQPSEVVTAIAAAAQWFGIGYIFAAAIIGERAE